MEVCKYASMQSCKNASMRVRKYTSREVCKYASMEVWRYESMTVYKHVSFQACDDVTMQIYNNAGMQVCNKKWNLCCNLLTRQSFTHFVNYALNPKTPPTKDVWFGMLFEYVTLKLKVKLSFGHKAVISSLSKLNIESKNFFYRSCSVWYATWKYHIKNES